MLGQRVRALRKQRGLNQRELAEHADLCGKFISEVERGEKSISLDNLYRVAVALRVPLSLLTRVERSPHRIPDRHAEQILALVVGRRRPAQVQLAHEVLRTILGRKSSGR
jgi:transcriptional regulator with XRE-family HTH domain